MVGSFPGTPVPAFDSSRGDPGPRTHPGPDLLSSRIGRWRTPLNAASGLEPAARRGLGTGVVRALRDA